MSPIFGLMKMVEMGLDKSGVRDSLENRQAAAQSGQAMQMANKPLMSPSGGGGLFSPPAPQMSPVMPPTATATPDMFDKALSVAEKFGGPQAGQSASPFQFLLQKAGVVDAPSTDQEQLMGLLASLGGGSGTGSMSILSGPQSPSMGTLASDITAQNLASGGLRGKLEKMIMGMA